MQSNSHWPGSSELSSEDVDHFTKPCRLSEPQFV